MKLLKLACNKRKSAQDSNGVAKGSCTHISANMPVLELGFTTDSLTVFGLQIHAGVQLMCSTTAELAVAFEVRTEA